MTCLRQQALETILMQDADAKAAAVRALPPVLQIDDDARCRTLAEPAGVPGRPARPELRHPSEMKNRAVGSIEGRAALLHALAHIESNAIDLALDIAWRFEGMPEAFYLDWLQVAREEVLHF